MQQYRETSREQRWAQRAERRRQELRKEVAGYAETLNLSQVQADELSRIFEESHGISRSIRRQVREGDMDRDEAWEMNESHQKSTEEQVMGLLGPDRTAELKVMREKEREERREQWRRSRGAWP